MAKRPAINFKLVPAEGGGHAKWDGKPMRPPKKGEYYLSGAKVTAYKAPNDLTTPYYIAVKVQT